MWRSYWLTLSCHPLKHEAPKTYPRMASKVPMDPATLPEESPTTLHGSRETKEARAFLRERFIRAILAMNGKPASFHMYENTNVEAIFGSCDREFVNIYVKNLQTPLGMISNALLRSNDIGSISINDINPSA